MVSLCQSVEITFSRLVAHAREGVHPKMACFKI